LNSEYRVGTCDLNFLCCRILSNLLFNLLSLLIYIGHGLICTDVCLFQRYCFGARDDNVFCFWLLGDVAVSLSDARGRDVAIETVDNGNNTFDVQFVPEVVGPMTVKVFFDDVEVPSSPYMVEVVLPDHLLQANVQYTTGLY